MLWRGKHAKGDSEFRWKTGQGPMYNRMGINCGSLTSSECAGSIDRSGGGKGLTELSQWSPIALVAIAEVLALILVLVAVLVALRRASSERQAAERRAKEISEESARKFRRLEQDLNFLVDFFRIFSRLVGEMHAERQVRMIPKALLNAVVRIFRPEVAAVLVRRVSPGADEFEGQRLSVAALHSIRGALTVGMEFKFGEGQVGSSPNGVT